MIVIAAAEVLPPNCHHIRPLKPIPRHTNTSKPVYRRRRNHEAPRECLQIVVAVIEVLLGRRSAAIVLHRVTKPVSLVFNNQIIKRLSKAGIASMRSTMPTPAAAEVVVRIRLDQRFIFAALRLDLIRGHWVVTDLQIPNLSKN